jgi:hypothetical protein
MIALMDANIWGFLAVPVGVLICFGPALAVWIRKECSGPPADDKDREQ